MIPLKGGSWKARFSWTCVPRAPENLKLAGNGPKMDVLCGLQEYKKKHIFVVFKLIIPIDVVFMHFLGGFLDLIGWHSLFPITHFGWRTLFSEAISAG